jgi:crotonobetainyl-CoA:carnitine CoA-transferase CaiB-like acyl-CoA transferase
MLLEEVEYPGGTKPIPVASTPLRLSETPARGCRRAPTVGEHTDEVLLEIGFSVDEVVALRSAGAV